ncbi:MAG: nicotinate (nicotinamide) nucleotide adenylyltransferase [Cytophagales bacterium]
MNIGLFFGSFNPIHIGHLVIANSIIEMEYVEEMWFVVSPQNPFKKIEGLLNENDRLRLVELAIMDNPKFKINDIEFNLEKPNYTYVTLQKLRANFPQYTFDLVMGADNIADFSNWHNYEEILEHHRVLVYPRPYARKTDMVYHPQVKLVQAPLFEISATFIREAIKKNKSVKYLLPEEVEKYIKFKSLYQ